jgi:hypothetical protein
MTFRQMTHCLCQFLDRVRFVRREFNHEPRTQTLAHGTVQSSWYIVGTYLNQRNNPSIAVGEENIDTPILAFRLKGGMNSITASTTSIDSMSIRFDARGSCEEIPVQE